MKINTFLKRLLLCSLITIPYYSFSAENSGKKGKRHPSARSLCELYTYGKAIQAVNQKLIHSSLGLMSNQYYPLVNIVLHYTFDYRAWLLKKQLKREQLLQTRFKIERLNLFENVFSAVHNLISTNVVIDYKNGEFRISHERSVSNKEVVEAVKYNAGQSKLQWVQRASNPNKTVLKIKD